MAPRNLLNLENVQKSYGPHSLLASVSLGIEAGERVGVVGRNGSGKSTLLKVMAGVEPPDAGRVTVANDVLLGILAQAGVVDPNKTIRAYVVGDRDEHDWASQSQAREVLTALLGSFDDAVLNRELGSLSGGERRRVELAHLLLQDLDLLILDEPTNHLDVEAVAWCAEHLKARRNLALIMVTHDRWFLDEVSDRTWELVAGRVESYDGGYSAYVLAKAERARQLNVEDGRRNNLIRKELAWLRRGAPARTTKPKFRVDAANQLISTEPPPRDNVELLAFAGARLGKTVFETHDMSLSFGDRTLIDRVTWNVGPGDRIGIVGVNGAGKTSLLRVLLGEIAPSSGKVVRGVTVKSAYLSQYVEELDPQWRVLEAVEHVAAHVVIGKGRELSASQLCERLGFGNDRQWTPVGDLSGGERRRLQLARLLMDGPNVLVLDEPTNDFDVETLAMIEDLLDSFAGTILVVSHDRYFLERVCDTFVGLLTDGKVRDLPKGVDEYLTLRRSGTNDSIPLATSTVRRSSGALRAIKKEAARLERVIAKSDAREAQLHSELAAQATDYVKVAELNAQLADLLAKKHEAEEAWLNAAELLS